METKNDYYANIAFGCVIAIVAAVVLTRNDITPTNGIYVWLLFIICIGLSYSVSVKRFSVRRASLTISSVMLATLAFKGALETLVIGTYLYFGRLG